ncbi:MAG: hypothetical protein ABII97_00245 [Patescibacteria group bacterium]
MEQYWMPKKLDFKNLRFCLNNYIPDYLFIRLVGSAGGTVKIGEDLGGKKLDFRKDSSGLHILIDSAEVFHFPLRKYQKGFSLAYERFFEDGRMYIAGGIPDAPYDPELPEPERSFLRQVLDEYLMEIYFKGRIDIKFYSWWVEPHWKYWTIDKSRN